MSEPPPAPPVPVPPPPQPPRLTSLDAYRGFVMLLLLGEVLRLRAVSKALPDSGFWKFMATQQSHVEWWGCSLHDLIQPSFSFMVGVALPFSLSSRSALASPAWRTTLHAFWRAFALVALGIGLRSLNRPQTYFTFEDTLTQIGLGYGFLYLLGKRPARDQSIALAVLLVGTWAAFALYPLPGPDFDWTQAGVKRDWPLHFEGFAAHWNKNTNLAWAFDRWFLNLFPREKPFLFNGGGYATLSFLPTLATMILGLLAGGVLKGPAAPVDKLKRLLLASAASFALGGLLHALGLCPIVKRIWTPSWVLFSGGGCFLIMAAFYGVVDLKGWKRWSFPLIVVGMNSIAAYLMECLFVETAAGAVRRHLPDGLFAAFGKPFEPLVHGVLTLAVLWLVLYWMYRRKIFLRI